MVYTNRFDENCDLSTTYLGQTKLLEKPKLKQRKISPLLDMVSPQENYWMVLAAKFC